MPLFQVPVPIVVPPQKKDFSDAAVQSDPLNVKDENPSASHVPSPGEVVFCILFQQKLVFLVKCRQILGMYMSFPVYCIDLH